MVIVPSDNLRGRTSKHEFVDNQCCESDVERAFKNCGGFDILNGFVRTSFT